MMERTSSFFILFSIPQVTVRGDLVEFVPKPETPYSPRIVGGNDAIQDGKPVESAPKN